MAHLLFRIPSSSRAEPIRADWVFLQLLIYVFLYIFTIYLIHGFIF
jgi:hypothetical protein